MKKSFLIFLAAFMCLAIFPVGAETSAAEGAQSNGMRFALAMEIMDGTCQATDVLTRRHLAQCYYNILMHNQDISGFDTKVFSDVEDADNAATGLCYRFGIMTGTGGNRFAPNEPVTYMQLIKTMVVFLGYEVRAEAEGGYPYGYIAVGNALGLYKDAALSMDAQVTVEQAAKMFRESADISLMQRTSFGNNEYEIKYGDNWLRLYHDTEQYRGIVKANHMTNLGGGGSMDYDRIMVGDTVFVLSDAAMELKNHIGYKVDIYVDTADEPGTIVYWEFLDAEKVVVDSGDVISAESNRITYFADGSRDHIDIDDRTWVIYNGSFCSSFDETVLNPFKDSYLDGSITALDNNGDGVYDLVEIDAYDTYVVSNIADGKIFNKYRSGSDAVIDTTKIEEEKMMITNVNGDEMWLSDITAGDIISVSRDRSGNIKRIVVTIDTRKGKITEITNDGTMTIALNDTVFECAASLALNPQTDKIAVGDTVEAFFNKDGKISDIEADEFQSRFLGYLVDAGSVSGISTRYEAKIFTTDGTFVIYPVAEKVEVEGKADVMKAADAIALAGKTDGGRVQRQIIQYDINTATGELNYIDYCDGTTPSDSLYRYTEYKGLYYRDVAMNFSGKLLMTSATKLFHVPTDDKRDNEDLYGVTTPNSSTFSNGTGYADKYTTFEAYGNRKMSYRAIALLLEKSAGKTYGFTDATYMFLVDKVTEIIEEDGTRAYKLTGVYNNGAREYLADFDVMKIAPDGGVPRKGDVIRVATDANNRIRNAEFIFRESDRTLYGMSNPSGLLSEIKRYAYGTVVYCEDGYVTIDVDGEKETHQLSAFRLACYTKNADEGTDAATVSTASAADVFDEYHYPGIGSKILIKTYYCQGNSIIIYND